jgi:hypothetical protein
MIFDGFERTNASTSTYSESTFRFLNRAAGPFWNRVRDLIEEWFGRLCDDAREDLRGRLRSDDNRQFRAAFWELYCHETLLRLGFEVTCHPSVEAGPRRPDFLAERDDIRFMLEATITGEADAGVAASRREAQVFDAINRVDSPNFTLALEVQRQGPVPPPTARLRPKLEEWLQSLDPDAVSMIGASENLLLSPRTPTLIWEESGWCIKFLPYPKSPAARGKPGGRTIGMHAPVTRWQFLNDARPIRRAVAGKATAYGQLDLPFIVAVEANPIGSLDDIDVMNALFGREQITLIRDQSGDVTSAVPTRAPDGAWVGPRGAQNTRVSGVLVAANVSPWRVREVVPTLWHHPAPKRPITVGRTPWRHVAVDRATGTTSFEPPLIEPTGFFDLDPGWPGPEPPFPH